MKSGWEAYEKALEELGADELCNALAQAMSGDELLENMEYISREYDLNLFDEDDEDEEEEEDLEESRKPRGKMLKESGLKNDWVAPSVRELAKGLKDGVEELWENREEGGCIHWPVYTDSNGTEFDIVLGWEPGFDDDPNYYVDGDYAICYAVKCQTWNNAMQTDMDIDFFYPYDEESGEVDDNGSSVSRNEDYTKLAKELLSTAKEMVKNWAA